MEKISIKILVACIKMLLFAARMESTK